MQWVNPRHSPLITHVVTFPRKYATIWKNDREAMPMFEGNVLDVIARRTSLRSYSKTPLRPEDRSRLEQILVECAANPFGAQVRMPLLETADTASRELGTYGIISGASLFMAGVVRHGEFDMEGLGFAMELAILHATDMGLGTCWLAGTFDHAGFTAAAAGENEMLPVVSPVGYPADKRTLRDSLMRSVAGSAARKPWDVLFFDGNPATPLTQEAAGSWAPALEAVRLAPSASNKQPWRVVRVGNNFHFFRPSSALGEIQRLDLGIAACHFQCAAQALSLPGAFATDRQPGGMPEDWLYCFTWAAA